MDRRKLLKYLLTVPVAAPALVLRNPFSMQFSTSQAASPKKLIVVFQRGGCDGLNTVIPYGDDYYYNLRPNIAIAPPDSANPDSAISLNDTLFGLHPALQPLSDIYSQGDLSILPAVHYPLAPRSHFVSQDNIEQGTPGEFVDGWLNRYLALNPGAGGIPAVSIGPAVAGSLRGDIPVPTVFQINQIGSLSANTLNNVSAVYDQAVEPADANRALLHAHGRLMFDNLDTFGHLRVEDYTPANNAVYPVSAFGYQMKQVAQIVKEDIGLEIAAVNSVGWDTHMSQGGASGHQAGRLADFASGISALYSDLGPSSMQDTLILTMTEFGRTAKENASLGTDHGKASAWFAIGSMVNGGIYGSWPGLANENLDDGRFLAHSLDFRDVLGEVVALHLNEAGSLGVVIPGHAYQSVGFL